MKHIKCETKRKQAFTRNIKSVLKKAKKTDFIEGATWYRDARLWSYGISQTYGVSFRKVCAMLAALSPRSKWERNKIDCEALIAHLSGCGGAFPKCGTYGAMVRKAIDIFNSKNDTLADMARLLNGPKITAFFLNIYDSESERVTVDTWMQLISLGQYIEVKKRPALSKTDYRLIEESIKEIAAMKNVAPPVMQAVLWVSFKRITEAKDYN